jgi:sigma-B regulation protein RsbU (phosphoserine phosphatase)
MKTVIAYIQQHLSLRLGLIILLIVGGVLGVSLSVLFYQTKQRVTQVAERHATQLLGETVQRIEHIMDEAEAATAELERMAQRYMEPDSLLSFTRQLLEKHPDYLGFTIAMKPDYFSTKGRNFSAYSLRRGDSIVTVVEDGDYFNQIWYRTPWEKKRAVWLEPYIDDTPGFLTSSEYNYSFVKPLYTANGEPVGVICTDLLLKWLSQTVTAVKPFPNSSAIMLGHDGHYIVHPDTVKLVRQSIFSDPDPQARAEVVPLGHAMISGQSGIWPMMVDGQPARVFFRPLLRTGWSIAIVCPDSDVFSGYLQLLYSVWAIIVGALLLLLIFCYLTIRRVIVPVNRLADATRRMVVDGEWRMAIAKDQLGGEAMGEVDALTLSHREDTVGRLQNSFVQMQQAISTHVAELQQITNVTMQRNQELQLAYELVREANKRKMAFVQDMAHEVRTPLNIISGFTQVIVDNYGDLPDNELADITQRMRESANTITHLTRTFMELKEMINT